MGSGKTLIVWPFDLNFIGQREAMAIAHTSSRPTPYDITYTIVLLEGKLL
jgi:hypothetical protein